MDLREFIENLRKSGVKPEAVRALALEKYDAKLVDEEMRSAFPDFKVAAPVASAPVEARNDAKEIAELCSIAGCSERAATFILEGKTIADVRSELKAERQKASVVPTATIQKDQIDKTRSKLVGAVALRSGMSAEKLGMERKEVEDLSASGARGLTFIDMARECLENAGVSTRGMNKHEIIKRSFAERTAPGHTSSDFPYVLSASVNKIALKAYLAAETTYQQWCGMGSLSDYKSTKLVNLSGFSDIQEIKPGQPAKQLTATDSAETAQLKDFGGIWVLDRQTIINDDLDVLKSLVRLNQAARKKINALAYGQLASTMADGDAVFHSNHANLGSTAAISTATIAELVKLLRLAKDKKNNVLNITPKNFLVSATKEALALAYLAANVPAVDASSAVNPYRGRFNVISDAEIDTQIATTSYFLTADPALYDTVTVFTLDGNDQPTITEQENMNGDPLGMSWQIYIPAIAKAAEYRTMVKNVGA